MDSIINSFTTIFNIEYTFVNMICIYFTIKVLVHFKPCRYNSSAIKKVITLIVSVMTGIVFYFAFNDNPKILLTSAMLSVVAYDYIIKRILKLLNIQY